jgi:hypothetical protein
VYGILSNLLAQVECSESAVMGCLEKMREIMVPGKVSHQLTSTFHEQVNHSRFLNVKKEEECFEILFQALPSCSRMLTASISVHVQTKFRVIEDLLLLGQCTLDFFWDQSEFTSFHPPTALRVKINKKISSLKVMLNLIRGRGFDTKEPREVLKMYEMCLLKLCSPNTHFDLQDMDFDSSLRFFVLTQTDDNYNCPEYNVNMKETMEQMQKIAHRPLLEDWAQTLISHSLFWGLLGDTLDEDAACQEGHGQVYKQKMMLLLQAQELLQKSGCTRRLGILQQLIEAAERILPQEDRRKMKKVYHRVQSKSVKSPENFNLTTLLKMEPKIALMIRQGCESAQISYTS